MISAGSEHVNKYTQKKIAEYDSDCIAFNSNVVWLTPSVLLFKQSQMMFMFWHGVQTTAVNSNQKNKHQQHQTL